jgi:hypothetical protein
MTGYVSPVVLKTYAMVQDATSSPCARWSVDGTGIVFANVRGVASGTAAGAVPAALNRCEIIRVHHSWSCGCVPVLRRCALACRIRGYSTRAVL